MDMSHRQSLKCNKLMSTIVLIKFNTSHWSTSLSVKTYEDILNDARTINIDPPRLSLNNTQSIQKKVETGSRVYVGILRQVIAFCYQNALFLIHMNSTLINANTCVQQTHTYMDICIKTYKMIKTFKKCTKIYHFHVQSNFSY